VNLDDAPDNRGYREIRKLQNFERKSHDPADLNEILVRRKNSISANKLNAWQLLDVVKE
jgi:hypothetical protein